MAAFLRLIRRMVLTKTTESLIVMFSHYNYSISFFKKSILKVVFYRGCPADCTGEEFYCQRAWKQYNQASRDELGVGS